MKLFFDIETAGQTDPATVDHLKATLKPPGTLKKAESIERWWQDEAPAALAAALERAGLDAETGQIIAIACATDDGRTWTRCRTTDESEADLISGFFNTVEAWTRDQFDRLDGADREAWFPGDDHYPVGHNIGGFDLPYLWKRCRILGVAVPPWIAPPGTRPGRAYGDTMTLWAGPTGRISLARLCTLLGINNPKAEGLDGAGVGRAWLAGEYERIADYCLRDVLATKAIWERLT